MQNIYLVPIDLGIITSKRALLPHKKTEKASEGLWQGGLGGFWGGLVKMLVKIVLFHNTNACKALYFGSLDTKFFLTSATSVCIMK